MTFSETFKLASELSSMFEKGHFNFQPARDDFQDNVLTISSRNLFIILMKKILTHTHGKFDNLFRHNHQQLFIDKYRINHILLQELAL
jgi:hypothetical protein